MALEEYSNGNDYITVKELQAYLRIGRNKAYDLVNQNDFPKIKIGRNIIIPKEDLKKYLQRSVYKTIAI